VKSCLLIVEESFAKVPILKLSHFRSIIFEVNIYKNIRIGDTTPNSVSTSWLCVTSNMKNSSHKM